MKLALTLIFVNFFLGSLKTPEISVNYIAKKQWKMSKHDIADIKLGIEREV